MIHIIITSYNEPNATLKAVNSFLNQKTNEKFKVIVCDPFEDVEKFLKKNIKDKRFEFVLDPGEGKTFAMNLLINQFYSKDKKDILMFSDGDVYVSENSINDIVSEFKDETVGCVTAKPVPLEPPTTKYTFWQKVLYDGIHKVRKRLSKEKNFFQSQGYLFAIRNGIINEIPIDVPEDCIIPYLLWKKGYRNTYAEKAEVYVKYPNNWKDWVNQRIRTIKAHENISKIAPDMPRTKSFFNEIKEGAFFVIMQPRSFMQFIWAIELYFARLYIYYKSFRELRKKSTVYDPGWREVEIKSTKPLD